MDPARHERISELFLAACERAPGERRAFLLDACAGDEGLLRAVEELLAADAGEAPVDGSPADRTWAAEALADLGDDGAPERIGSYELLGVLGEGGMGVVYRARQQRPAREVALKVVRASFAGGALSARFEVEAALLGRLRHPGIAQIYEAGVAEGRAFFAMELVDGVPLDVWIERARPDRDERLALLARVADAVAHAGQQGIVHRDLKPSNVLVDADGRPRIVDFGVARAVGDADDDAGLTRTGQLVGTLAYMSPEQVSGDPAAVDVRTDVYALGALLYEALAGRRPVDVEGVPLVEAARRIAQDEPPRLGALDRALRGDVEVIAHTALAKEKERRYASAAAFAGDLRRTLADEPIEARPASTVYQLQKLARRHRAWVGGIALALVALLAGLAATLVEARRARDAAELAAREEARATREAAAALEALAESDAVVEFLGGLFQAVHPDQLGREVRVEDVLEVASEELDREFADRPGVLARLADALGRSWSTLGRHERAHEALERASGLYAELHGDDDPRTIRARGALVLAAVYLGRYEEGLELVEPTLAAARRTFGEGSLETADLLESKAALLLETGRAAEAEPLLRAAVAAGESAPDDPRHLQHLQALASVVRELGRFEESIDLARRAHERAIEVLGPDHWKALEMAEGLGVELHSAARFDEARDVLEPTLARAREVHGPEHPETNRVAQHLALVYLELGRPGEARELLEAAARVDLARHGAEHPTTLLSQRYLLQAVMRGGDVRAALDLAGEVAVGYERRLGPEHPSSIEALATLGRLHLADGAPDEAEGALVEALARAEEALVPAHVTRVQLVVTLGTMWREQGRFDEALELVHALREAAGDATLGVPSIHYQLVGLHGALLADTGRFEEAAPELEAAAQGMAAALGEDAWQTLDLRSAGAKSLLRAGDAEGAVRAYRAARELALAGPGLASAPGFSLTQGLAAALVETGELEDAIELLEDALLRLEADSPEPGVGGAHLLSTLAGLYERDGRDDEALATRDAAHAAFARLRGAGHPETQRAAAELERLRARLSASDSR